MERRQHPRVRLNQTVEVRLCAVQGREDLSDVVMSCTAADVSADGICLHMDAGLSVGTAISMRITLPDPPSLFTVHGVVRWTRPESDGPGYVIGLELSDPADNYLYDWRRMVSEMHRE